MTTDVDSIVSDIASSVLVWCGVDNPASTETAVAQLAATNAVETIKHYRGLGADAAFEPEYMALAVEMATYLWQKRGVDGVTGFSENGVQRSFEAGSFPKSMLSRITLATETG
jgi:hypothetical protein